MTDTNKLKELAERALAEEVEPGYRWALDVDPQELLELISEVERLRGDLPRLISYAEDLSTCTLTMDDGIGYFFNRVTEEELNEMDRLKAENAALREKLGECSVSLQGEMMQKYGGQEPEDMHPVTKRDYDRDMAEIAEYMAALEGGGR